MDNLAINDSPQALAAYSRHQIDRTYADQYETVLGHLVCERGRSVKAALEDLRPIVAQTRRQTLSAVDWCQKIGFGGIGVGVLVGAGMGAAYAVLPIIAGTIGIKFWADSRSEMPRRDAEYHLLKTAPNLPEALYAFHLRGIQAVQLIGAYDQLVAAIESRLEGEGDFTEHEVAEFLKTKVENAHVIDSTLAQSGIQPSNDQDAPRSEGQPLAQTELQDHSVDVNKMVAAASPTMVHSKVLCPIEVMGREPYQSTALIGGQRSGKTYIVALHTQNVKRSHKSKVIYVNLYDALGDAADDWTHADVCLTFHIKKMAVSQAKAAIEKVIAAVEQFNNDTNAIFVFDEWVAFTSKSNAWAKKASQENTAALVESKASQCYMAPEGIGTSAVELMNEVMSVSGELGSIGKKQLKAIWLLSPMVKASALEPQGLCMKDLAPMVVAIPPDRSITWEHPDTGIVQEITFDDAGYRASMVNLGLMPIEKVPHMEVDRMMCLKSVWYSLDNLPPLEKSSAPETKKLSQGQVNWERLKVGSPAFPEATDAIDVETTAIDDRPEGLDAFPLVLTIWEYLDGKDARSLKQISDSMRAKGKIPEDILKSKLGQFETYKDAIKTVVSFGVSKGYLKQVSEDAYEATKKH